MEVDESKTKTKKNKKKKTVKKDESRKKKKKKKMKKKMRCFREVSRDDGRERNYIFTMVLSST